MWKCIKNRSKLTWNGNARQNVDNYLYRVGNINDVKLINLFTFNEQKFSNGNLSITIYDVLQTSGDGTKVEISQDVNGNQFNASYNKNITKETWNNEVIKFNGNGIALIKITYQDNNLDIKYEVEVIVLLFVTIPSLT